MRHTLSLSLFVIFYIGCIHVCAQTTTWTGASSKLWEDSTNWDNGVPNETISAVVPFAASISSTFVATAKSLSLVGGSNITFNDDVYIQNLTQNQAIINFMKRGFIDYYTVFTNANNILIYSNFSVNVSTFFNWTGSSGLWSPAGIEGKLNLLSTCTSIITASGSLAYVTINNYGNLTLSGSLSFFNSRIINQPAATFTFANTVDMTIFGSGTLSNFGNMINSVSTSTLLYVTFENKGVLDIQNGNLTLRSECKYTLTL